MAGKMKMAETATAVVMMMMMMMMATIQVSEQKKLTVGDFDGWSLSTDYNAWIKKQTFAVGDTLEFNFNQGAHDVTPVSKEDYDSCNLPPSGATNSLTEPPVSIKINSTTPLYFVCSIPGHCAGGQKLAVIPSGGAATKTPASAPRSSTMKGHITPTPVSSSPAATPPASMAATPPPSYTDAPPPPSDSSDSGSALAAPPPTAISSATSLTAAGGLSVTFFSIAVLFY